MTPLEQYYETVSATIIKGLEKRQMEGYYYPTAKEAINHIISMIPEGAMVAWGGSQTMEEIGLKDLLKSGNYNLIDRDSAPTPEEKKLRERNSYFSDYYFMSTNAITKDGELVNIDGSGNRVSALINGPSHIIILAGMNKIAENTEDAIQRVHTTAAPPNCVRLNLKTPCSQTGVCKNCLSPDCICSHTVITRFSRTPGRVKVFLIGETLGY